MAPNNPLPPCTTPGGPKTPHGKANENSNEASQNIKVFVRVRPMKETEKKNVVEVIPEHREVRVNERSTAVIHSKTFTFDNAFGVDTPQIEVYRSVVAPLVEQVVMGYNCTVFAYGQTGTGKTYTMEGERSTHESCSWEDDPLCGIIPRALAQLFETLQAQASEHTVRVSFLELYNEELYDLLSPLDDTTRLKIFEDPARKGSTVVGGLEEVTVHTKAEIYDILRKGSAKRQTAATLLNMCSSRSHTIFSVTVHIKENSLDGEEMLKIGKINLVDLAGSENIGRSGAIEKRAREAGNINQSLLTLGRVITCLVERGPHIPYRESKLTRLLQDSLGGRTKTSIIATISPNILDVEDSLSTLDYAHRAKRITNKPEVNQKLSKKTLLREYTAEIERLRRDLAACREKNGFFINVDNYNQLQDQIKAQNDDIEMKCAQIQALKDEMEKINLLFEETRVELETRTVELEKTSKTLEVTSEELLETKSTLQVVDQDRNEQKYLVDVHVTNEKILSEQAKQLLNVTQQTTNDVEKLHDKVERQRDVEMTNKTKSDEFQKKFCDDLTRLEELVRIHTCSYHDSLSEMHENIKEKFDGIEGLVKDLSSNMSTFNDAFNEENTSLSTLHTKDRVILEQAIQLKDINDDVKCKLVENLNGSTQLVNEGQEALQNGLQALLSTVAQQRVDMEASVMKLSTFMDKSNETTLNAFKELQNKLKQHFDSHKIEMQSFKSEIERLQSESIEAKQSMSLKWDELDKLLLSVNEKANEIKLEQIRNHSDLVKSSSCVIEKYNEATTRNDDARTLMSLTIDEYCEKVNSQKKIGVTYIGKIDDLSTQNTQVIMDDCNGVVSKCGEANEVVKKSIEDSKKQSISKLKESGLVNDDMIKMMDKSINDKHIAMNKMKERLGQQVDVQTGLIGQTESHMKETSQVVTNKTSEMKRISTTMEQSHLREIEKRIKEFERFVKYELVKYNETGTTPQKTNYDYPTDLVATSPHDRILRRYRAALNPSEALLTPLPEESNSELLSPMASIISSSSLSRQSSMESLKSNTSNSENVPRTKAPGIKTSKSSDKLIGNKSKTSNESNKNSKNKSTVDSTFIIDSSSAPLNNNNKLVIKQAPKVIPLKPQQTNN